MLVLTGVMLGAVLIVMVGESVQELQLAHWLPTTELGGPTFPAVVGDVVCGISQRRGVGGPNCRRAARRWFIRHGAVPQGVGGPRNQTAHDDGLKPSSKAQRGG